MRFLDHRVTGGTEASTVLTSRVSKKTVDVRFLFLHEDQSKVEGKT